MKEDKAKYCIYYWAVIFGISLCITFWYVLPFLGLGYMLYKRNKNKKKVVKKEIQYVDRVIRDLKPRNKKCPYCEAEVTPHLKNCPYCGSSV